MVKKCRVEGADGESTGDLKGRMRSGLIGIWIECELGEENARIDDDDLYSLRAGR